jgi:hypothetical protein
MSFPIQCGFIGDKEKFIVKRYLEEEREIYGDDSKIYLEKNHDGRVKGVIFDEFEELLDEGNIREFKNIEEYIQEETDGMDDEDLEEYTPETDIESAFEDLDGNLYVLSDNNGEHYNTSKELLIIQTIKDGQEQLLYENFGEALEDINNSNEMLAVFIYNDMSEQEKNQYIEEYELLNSESTSEEEEEEEDKLSNTVMPKQTNTNEESITNKQR